jgi:hypothetical protein
MLLVAAKATIVPLIDGEKLNMELLADSGSAVNYLKTLLR